ncbi:MAG: DMT family transporter [Alphaproteobacteria bacterium]|nr:DMT family transporter [Alphaproteobacteria bacterium]
MTTIGDRLRAAQSDRAAAVTVIVSAAAWGIYWLPVRVLADAGLTGAWSAVVQFGGAFLLLVPFAALRVARGQRTGLRRVLPGLFMGGGIVLYASSFLFTDVVRALLLFYLNPVWGTLLEVIVLRRRIARQRYLTIALGLGGLWLAVAEGSGLPLPRNLGDWLGLAAGASTALGVMFIRRGGGAGLFETLFSFLGYGTLVGLLPVFLFADLRAFPPLDGLGLEAALWLAFVILVFQLAGNATLLWGAAQIDPGRFGILVMVDLVVGVVSAAALAGEPFGWHQALGSGLIVGAGLLEVLVVRPQRLA